MYSQRYFSDPFTDLLFNILLGITLFFFLSVALINPQNPDGKIDPKADFIISATWPENLTEDIDLWVENPDGDVVSYLHRDGGWMHLDRDDRGELNDMIIINGLKVLYPINQEIVTIRGSIIGEYTVNVYYYKSDKKQIVPVTVKVERVNPEFELVFVDQIILEKEGSEKTAVRFTLDIDNQLVKVNRLPRILTPTRWVPTI